MFFGKIYFAALLPVNASAAVLTISVLYIAALFLAYGFLFNRKTISCKTMRNLLSVFFKLTRQSPRSRASTDFGSLLAYIKRLPQVGALHYRLRKPFYYYSFYSGKSLSDYAAFSCGFSNSFLMPCTATITPRIRSRTAKISCRVFPRSRPVVIRAPASL